MSSYTNPNNGKNKNDYNGKMTQRTEQNQEELSWGDIGSDEDTKNDIVVNNITICDKQCNNSCIGDLDNSENSNGENSNEENIYEDIEEYYSNGQCKSRECGNCKDCDYKEKYGPEFDSGYHPRKEKSLAEKIKEANKNGKVLGFGELLGFDTTKRIEEASKRIVKESAYIPENKTLITSCITNLKMD